MKPMSDLELALFPILFSAVKSTSGVVEFDPADFLIRIEWFGPETKPVNRAALGTKNRKKELEEWQRENSRFCHIAIISENEVIALEKLLWGKPFSLKRGLFKTKQIRQQYVILIDSGERDYYFELGFSREILGHVELIKGCLGPGSREPLERIAEQVRSWKY